MRISLHNHSVFSDGQDTPYRIYQAALAQHVDVLGLSDHYYRDAHDAIRAPEWALQYDKIDLYFRQIELLRKRHGSIEVLAGMEFDWLEDAEMLRTITLDPRLDFTIGSVHYIRGKTFDESKHYWLELSTEERDDAIAWYWCAIKHMAESGLFQIVGHIDLIKKFAIYPTRDMTPYIIEALDAIKVAGMVVELNTSGWIKDCKSCYPSEEILRACFAREIPVMVSSDSHRGRFVASNFSRGTNLLKHVGYTQLALVRNREISFFPIS